MKQNKYKAIPPATPLGWLHRIAGQSADMLKRAVSEKRRRRSFGKASRELGKLSDRQLKDIGLSRDDLDSMAWKPFRNSKDRGDVLKNDQKNCCC